VLTDEDGKGLETINRALSPNAPNANTPTSLSLTPDGELLFVANADANNVAVFGVAKPGKARPLGFIPAGMYPTSVRYNPAGKRLYTTNGRGSTPKANPHGPKPGFETGKTVRCAHRLARQFVLLDNFYVDGEVSAEGHEWSMGAYCTDFVKRVWPLSYRGSPTKKLDIYPAEGTFDEVARPAGGYIWDRCAEAGVSYRSYGEWIANGKTPKDPGKARVKALEGHFDPWYRSYDLDYPDAR